jgi:hypothetical protein
MKKAFPGLSNGSISSQLVPAGLYLARVRQSTLRSRGEKPYLQVELEVLEPTAVSGRTIRTRLYCTPKALWKVQWFLRDFGYAQAPLVADEAPLVADEIDDKGLRNLSGVIKVSHHDINGRTWVNLDGFSPAASWKQSVWFSDTP